MLTREPQTQSSVESINHKQFYSRYKLLSISDPKSMRSTLKVKLKCKTILLCLTTLLLCLITKLLKPNKSLDTIKH